MPSDSPLSLGRRERQIAEVLYRLGEASVARVREELPDPPSYSAVRAMLNLLVRKGVVAARHEGKRYLYRPVTSKQKVRRSALRSLVRTFFGSTPVDAVAALVDGSAGRLSPEDLRRVREMVERAEAEEFQKNTRKPDDRLGSKDDRDNTSNAG